MGFLLVAYKTRPGSMGSSGPAGAVSGGVAGSAPGGLQDQCALPGFNNRDIMIVRNPLP